MRKVLIFSLNYYPFVGGAEVAIKEITDRIAPAELEFHLIALRRDARLPKEEKIGNVFVHRIDTGKYLYQFGAFFAANRLHRTYHFDAIWAMMAHSAGIPAGLFKTFHPRVKYLLTLQEGDPPEYIERQMRVVWPLFKRGFTEADALQAISTFLLAWGKRMGFAGDARVVPNGVDVAHFARDYAPEEIATMRAKLGKKQGDVFLVTTSRLVHKNGIDDVIRALAHLPGNVSFLIYGIGPDEEKLKALAQELGVSARSRFMGQIAHESMPRMLKACDIFIRPSRSEGMGNSFIEAMAAGVPVIATQEGGIADFLFDAKRDPNKAATGFAVDKDSPEQIAEAVRDILAEPQRASRVAVAAKTLVSEHYDWNHVAEQMRALFATLLA